MSRTTYIAGKMRSVPFFNFPAFDAAAAMLREQGHFVLSPAEHDREDLGLNPDDFPTGQFSDQGWTESMIRHFMRQAFAWDMAAVCRATTIALLPGWQESAGTAVELAAANLLKLEVIEL